MKAQFRPCIDLHNGVVKQIVGGTLESSATALQTNFVSSYSPRYYAKLYKKHQLTGGHVIKLGPGNDQAAREALQAYPGGLQVGGGITADNAKSWLEAGADKVIVTSFIFSDGKFQEGNLQKLLQSIGKNHLVLDLSCRKKGDKYFVVTDRWQKFTALEVNAATLEFFGSSAAEFLIHAVDVEGKQSGIDPELLQLLADFSPLDCVYAGGIASLSDIALIEKAGRGRVHYTIGSALDIFGGHLKFETIVNRAAETAETL